MSEGEPGHASDSQQPVTLEYATPMPSEYKRGATRLARIASVVFAVFFALVAIDMWRYYAFAPSHGIWPASGAAAGSVFCLLVALGVIGKHKATKPISGRNHPK